MCIYICIYIYTLIDIYIYIYIYIASRAAFPLLPAHLVQRGVGYLDGVLLMYIYIYIYIARHMYHTHIYLSYLDGVLRRTKTRDHDTH